MLASVSVGFIWMYRLWEPLLQDVVWKHMLLLNNAVYTFYSLPRTDFHMPQCFLEAAQRHASAARRSAAKASRLEAVVGRPLP